MNRLAHSIFFAILSLLLQSPTVVAQTIPNGALGVVSIDFVKVGHLPFLYGLKGEGRYLTYGKEGELCQVAHVPLVAGSFNSQEIGFGAGGAIELVIYNAELSERLKTGQKAVSAHYNVSIPSMMQQGDIEIVSGLTLAEGFVLHPRKAWSSWFGYHPKPLTCEPVYQHKSL